MPTATRVETSSVGCSDAPPPATGDGVDAEVICMKSTSGNGRLGRALIPASGGSLTKDRSIVDGVVLLLLPILVVMVVVAEKAQ